MGKLEGRARRLEEEAKLDRQAEQCAKERALREGISRLSAAELQAMHDYFEQRDSEEWTEEDAPLMRRLLALREEAQRESAGEDFPWRAEMRKELDDADDH